MYEEEEKADNGNDQYSTLSESTSNFSGPESPKKNAKKRYSKNKFIFSRLIFYVYMNLLVCPT